MSLLLRFIVVLSYILCLQAKNVNFKDISIRDIESKLKLPNVNKSFNKSKVSINELSKKIKFYDRMEVTKSNQKEVEESFRNDLTKSLDTLKSSFRIKNKAITSAIHSNSNFNTLAQSKTHAPSKAPTISSGYFLQLVYSESDCKGYAGYGIGYGLGFCHIGYGGDYSLSTKFSCSSTAGIITIYNGTTCDTYFTEIPALTLNECANDLSLEPTGVSSVYKCASEINELVSGEYVVSGLLYDSTDSTCSGDALAFTAQLVDYCINTTESNGYASSFKETCNRDNGPTQIIYYNDASCSGDYIINNFDTSCSANEGIYYDDSIGYAYSDYYTAICFTTESELSYDDTFDTVITSGYGLQNIYSGVGCTGERSVIFGNRLGDACIVGFNNDDSLSYTVNQCTSSNGTLVIYNGTDCDSNRFLFYENVLLNTCFSFSDSIYGKSYKYSCIADGDDPFSAEYVVQPLVYSFDDSTCSDYPILFTAYLYHYCINVNINGSDVSYRFNCNRDFGPVEQFYYSANCTGHSVHSGALGYDCSLSDDGASYSQGTCATSDSGTLTYDDEIDVTTYKSGYYSLKVYSEDGCEGNNTYNSVLKLGQCAIGYDGNDSLSFIGSCSDSYFVLEVYEGTECESSRYLLTDLTELNQCYNVQLSFFGPSFQYQCTSTSDKLPLDGNYAINTAYYNASDSSCSGLPVNFGAFLENYCFNISNFAGLKATCNEYYGSMFFFTIFEDGYCDQYGLTIPSVQDTACLLNYQNYTGVPADYYKKNYCYSSSGTIETDDYTFYPTITSTVSPTIKPKKSPTKSPTISPTINPAKTSEPTFHPTLSPTPQPSSFPQTYVAVAQSISGVGYSNYTQNSTAYDLSIQQAIVNSVTGITIQDITQFTVIPPVSNAVLNVYAKLSVDREVRAAASTVSTNNELAFTYVIVSTSSTLTSASVINQLNSSIVSGTFETVLHEAAVANGAPSLVTATPSTFNAAAISSPTSAPVSSHHHKLSSKNRNIIIIVVIVVVVGGTLIALIAHLIFAKSKKLTISPATGGVELQNNIRTI